MSSNVFTHSKNAVFAVSILIVVKLSKCPEKKNKKTQSGFLVKVMFKGLSVMVFGQKTWFSVRAIFVSYW